MAHHVELPPLRDRIEDLPLLLRHFYAEACAQLGKKVQKPPGEILPLLSTYPFPGNIRELQAMIYDAVSRSETGSISPGYIKDYIQKQNPAGRRKAADAVPQAHFSAENFPSLESIEDH